MSDQMRVALIAALSALAGTAIGGLVSYSTSRSLQDREFDHEQRQRLLQARSAAAIEQYRFNLADRALSSMVRDRVAVRLASELNSDLTGVEQQLIVSYLDRRRVAQYAEGRLCVDLFKRKLRQTPAGGTVSETTVLLLRQWHSCVRTAEGAVQAVAARRDV